MSSVSLRAVSKNYGAHAALRTLDHDIAEGEFLTLLGLSGCGKTTTLRLVAGFIDPTGGRIEQFGTAIDFYNRPATRFVAGFVGQINLIEAEASTGDAGYVDVRGTRMRIDGASLKAGHVTLGVRPEQLRILDVGDIVDAASNSLDGVVRATNFAGSVVKVEIDAGLATPIVVEVHPDAPAASVGARVRVAWRVASASVLPN
jgi:ABC-type Fe3+/spermidine/putrescine transport system ATPase subunit